MNSLTSQQLTLLKQQLEQLLNRAENTDLQRSPGQRQHWFDSALFSHHSPDLADYVRESLHHLQHLTLHGANLSSAARQRLTEHLHAQINALTQAFRNEQTRKDHQQLSIKRTQHVVKKLAANSQQLYQQLSEYQQFESRLQDMVRLAQRESGSEATQKALALHARLGRCRRAIDEVEQAIQKLEAPK